MDNSTPPIQIVDENDRPIGQASKQEIWSKGLWHRIVRIMLVDEKNRLLLQKRAPNKHPGPNCWDDSAAGHVDVGEDYFEAAKRELAEELGVSVELVEEGNFKVSHIVDGLILNRFNKVYSAKVNHDIVMKVEQKDIAEVRWFNRDEVERLIEQEPDKITNGLKEVLKRYYNFDI